MSNKPKAPATAILLLLASVGLYCGWRLFWFLTDDAFIAFRYVSNSVLGFGYTWNLPPFGPVEGYTSFLWVVLLDIVWRVTGIEPPDAANTISLLFAYGTTFLGAAALLKMELKSPLEKIRLPLLALVLIGVLTNRTYLAWTSSGLETAMFNFFFLTWVYCCLFIRPNTSHWLGWMAMTSMLTALSRPDGLLLVAASLFLGVLTVLGQIKAGSFRPRYALSFAPFLVTAAHFLWRKHKYGKWLPNTHAAKYVAAWPASGLRYALSFVIEYALWFWLALALVFILPRLHHLLRQRPARNLRTWLSDPTPTRPLIALTIVGTLFVHFVYYTLVIGGDHFEYRVYSHLVLLFFLSSVWLLNALNATAPRVLAFLGLFVLCALPIQWTHWAATRNLYSYEETHVLRVPIASRFPKMVRPYVRLFDSLQSWLIEHHVGTRHQEQ
jgi:arabinofuranosyltransferase